MCTCYCLNPAFAYLNHDLVYHVKYILISSLWLKKNWRMAKENKPLTKFICFDVHGIWRQPRKMLKTSSICLLYLFLETTHVLWDPVYKVHLNIQQPVIYSPLGRLVTVANRTSLHLVPILLPVTPFYGSFPQIQIYARDVPHINLPTPLKSCHFLLHHDDAQRYYTSFLSPP